MAAAAGRLRCRRGGAAAGRVASGVGAGGGAGRGGGGAARRLWVRGVSPRAEGDHRRPAGRARLRRRHADRRRQVADLPDPGPDPGRHDAGGVTADRADERPGRRPGRGRPARHLPERDAGARRARSPRARAGGGRVRDLLRGARGDRSVGRARAGGAGPAPDRRRRGPLHQPVGPRLPAGVPQPGGAQAAVRRRAARAASRSWR